MERIRIKPVERVRVVEGPGLSAFLTLVLYSLHVGRDIFPPHASPLVNLGLVERVGEGYHLTGKGRARLLKRVYFR